MKKSFFKLSQGYKFGAIAAVLLLTNCSESKKPEASDFQKETPKVEAAPASVDQLSNKGIGPIKEVSLGPVNNELAAEGKKLFLQLCSACHMPDQKLIGPAPKDILKRRSPEWVLNMIINPVEMLEKDPIAMQLLVEANGVPMANQNVSEEDAKKILEYFRTL
ncbi:MAG: cytochrome c [Cyclobacteriaceae bacterium]|jgi:mono/diheme cytochrome c family protein